MARVARRALLAIVLALAAPLGLAHAAVELTARVSRGTLTVGETTTLDVIVRGALTGVHDPEFDVPPGLSLLGTSRTQSFSAINGQTSVEVVQRFEIGATEAGFYALGPIRVRVGNQTYESPGAKIRVTPSREQVSGRDLGPATLVVDVSPADPYVGQPVVMRVRLIQRATLAEDPSYAPPPTPGFWSERASQPESYYADQGNSRVLVTETRTRLYPLAAGAATIGEATATLAIAVTGGAMDPLQWLGGRPPRREVVVRSQPVRVKVRELPHGAPASFSGAVGTLVPAWQADRATTSLDIPVSVGLELRGTGNLPLIHTPALVAPDVEPFASTIEDSLASPGTGGAGLRRFQWTVLPRHQGEVRVPAPKFAWFDPHDERYHVLDADPVVLEVGPPQSAGTSGDETFPAPLASHPLDPFGRGAQPWAFGLAGLALGFAVRLWWSASRPPVDHVDRAQQREWVHAVQKSTGNEFWKAADRACEWLEVRGQSVAALRRQIESSRYGGTRANVEIVQRELITRLNGVIAPPPPRWTTMVSAVALALAAIALVLLLGPHGGSDRDRMRAQAADQAARRGEIERAKSQWLALWREGARAPALAARLGWVELRAGAIGPASWWALRGDREEPRDRALEWVIGKIRETGGLTGFTHARLPVRRLEWALLALVAGVIAVASWPRRLYAAAAGAVLLVAALIYPVQGFQLVREGRAVVTREVQLAGSDVELEPGQVIRVLGHEGERVRASAGRGIMGWLPARAIAELGAR